MRLIYAYVKKFRNISNQEIYFSDQYKVSIEESKTFPECMTISRQEDKESESFIYKKSNLSNVHLIVGKTGSGKTNVLQMIGMPEQERTYNHEEGEAYFLLYKAQKGFVIEIFNIPVNPAFTSGRKKEDEFRKMLEQVRRYSNTLRAMHMYSFMLNKDGKPISLVTTSPEKLVETGDITYIFNGYERHAFPFCPYEEKRIDLVDTSSEWQVRTNAEYHKTALWYSCRFLKEYIENFGEDNLKQKAALVINRDNWAKTIKQHIDESLEDHDYWTFADNKRQDDENIILGKPIKQRRYPAIRNQFVHDLWTDYALYLREWIAYIKMYPEDKASQFDIGDIVKKGTNRVYKRIMAEEKKRSRIRINPKVIPDYEDISILHRIKWLSMYIDLRGDGTSYHLLYQIYDDIKDIGNILNQFDDKYFTNNTFTLPIADMYTEENRELVEKLFERMEGYRPDDTGIFTNELLPYHFLCISSGEYQFAKILGGIEELCVRLSVDKTKPHIIYLLDEPETYMHPELCRTFLKRLDDVLKERTARTDIQIIISTHSPLLLSDVLPGQITRLDLDKNGYCLIKNSTEKAYFGANIHTILADGFFLDYTIGEYARVFLQENINWLKEFLVKENKTVDDKHRVQELKSIVPYIGDPLIKNSFEVLIWKAGENIYD